MSYLLHIETATKVCSVALSKDGKLVQLQEIADDQYSHGEKLTLLIQEVIDLEKIEMKNLNAVSVSAGPGSYTGLRIGVSTAKGLCYALSIPLISIDTLTSMAQDESLKGGNKSICSMIDARRMEVFSALFNSEGECIKMASPDVLDETTYSEFEPFVCIGDGAEKTKDLWSNRSIEYNDSFQISAKTQVEMAYKKFQAQEFEDVAYFEPNYIKAFHDTRK